MKPTLPKRYFKQKPKQEVIATPVKIIRFPSIPRIIPEALIRKYIFNKIFLTALCCGFLTITIAMVGYETGQNWLKLSELQQQRKVIEQKAAQWKKILGKYKGYRDGYYQLAVLEYQLGDKQAAYDNLQEIKKIDQNDSEADKFIEKLTK